jgi:hypothetical protein
MHINLFFEFNAQINVLNTQGYKLALTLGPFLPASADVRQ